MTTNDKSPLPHDDLADLTTQIQELRQQVHTLVGIVGVALESGGASLRGPDLARYRNALKDMRIALEAARLPHE
jgi:hypothetical protein